MSEANPYQDFVAGFARLLADGQTLGAPPTVFPHRAAPAPDAPRCLIFSPHPDDEVLTGALPLRLRRAGWWVGNVAVTLGSARGRRVQRLAELRAACAYLGFQVLLPRAEGFENINLQGRQADPVGWAAAAAEIAALLTTHAPALILMPHAGDWNRTHIGTHWLVQDALARMPAGFHCRVLESEFWGAMSDPNLLVESTPAEVAELVAALSLHRGEVARNPYHLRLPAWMMDNVRRGAELVGGQGAAAPDFVFATLYRLGAWQARRWQAAWAGGRFLSGAEPADRNLGPAHPSG